MKKLTLTIAICERNRCKLLEDLILNVLDQTVKADEIIVVDDVSTDSTKKMLKKYSNKIKAFFLKKHFGLAYARNIALTNCSTDIIVYIDSDVSISDDLIEIILKKYKKFNCDGIGGKGIESNIRNFYDEYRKKFFSQSFGNKLIKFPEMLMGIIMSYKTEFLRSIGGFNNYFYNYGEDVECGIRANKKGYLIYDPEISVFHKRTDTFFSLLKIIYKYAYWESFAYSFHKKKNNILFSAIKYFFIIIYQSLWYYKDIKTIIFTVIAGSFKLAGHIYGMKGKHIWAQN